MNFEKSLLSDRFQKFGSFLREDKTPDEQLSKEVVRSINEIICDRLWMSNLLKELEKERKKYIDIHLDGKLFDTNYTGPVPDKELGFGMSNERFERCTFRAMDEIRDIKRVLGIVGGYGYPFSLLLHLMQKNTIESCKFVDINVSQILNAMVKTAQIERELLNQKGYLWYYGVKFDGDYQNAMTKKLAINFENTNLTKEVKTANIGGIYFIYASSAYIFPMKRGAGYDGVYPKSGRYSIGGGPYEGVRGGKRLLKAMLRNQSIEPGSLLIANEANSSNFVIFRKNESDLSLHHLYFGAEWLSEALKPSVERYLRKINS